MEVVIEEKTSDCLLHLSVRVVVGFISESVVRNGCVGGVDGKGEGERRMERGEGGRGMRRAVRCCR